MRGSTVRIQKEFAQQAKNLNDSSTVRARIVDDVLTDIEALIIGPSDTPYAGGAFLFAMTLPSEYPLKPPQMKITTTGGGRVRFNPNLYATGKVCVTVLNTFGAKEWSPVLTIEAVLRTVESMMTPDPFHNEPGFETCSRRDAAAAKAAAAPDKKTKASKKTVAAATATTVPDVDRPTEATAWPGILRALLAAPSPASSGDTRRGEAGLHGCERYALKIRHETLRVAVVYPLARITATAPPSISLAEVRKQSPAVDVAFQQQILNHMLPQLPDMITEADALAPLHDGKPFHETNFEGGGNTAAGTFHFATVAADLRAMLAAATRLSLRAVPVEAAAAVPTASSAPAAGASPAAAVGSKRSRSPASDALVQQQHSTSTEVDAVPPRSASAVAAAGGASQPQSGGSHSTPVEREATVVDDVESDDDDVQIIG